MTLIKLSFPKLVFTRNSKECHKQGETFSVDENLKTDPQSDYYVFCAIENDDYAAFRQAISKENFQQNLDLIYAGEGRYNIKTSSL